MFPNTPDETSMLIACPSCTARYEIEAAKLGPAGRKVRCAACETLWHVDPPSAVPDGPAPGIPPAPPPDETTALLEEELRQAALGEPEPEVDAGEAEVQAPPAHELATDEPAAAAPPIEPARRKPAPRRKGGGARRARRSRALRLPLAIGFGGLALIAAVTWQREAAVRAAPQLAGLFAMAGLPVNVLGLRLSAVESSTTSADDGRFLIVEGDVTNIARGVRPIPPIEVAVRDEAGQPLYTWTTDPPRPQLEPAEIVRFRARLATPPEAGRSVTVRFVSETR